MSFYSGEAHAHDLVPYNEYYSILVETNPFTDLTRTTMESETSDAYVIGILEY